MPVDAELKRKKNKYIHVIIEVEEAEGEGNMSATGNKRKHGPVDICSNKFHFFCVGALIVEEEKWATVCVVCASFICR